MPIDAACLFFHPQKTGAFVVGLLGFNTALLFQYSTKFCCVTTAEQLPRADPTDQGTKEAHYDKEKKRTKRHDELRAHVPFSIVSMTTI